MEINQPPFTITTDKSRIDLGEVHRFLSTETYWAKNIPLEIVQRSVDHSLCFSLFYESRQIGFARIITDKATFAYMSDVYILKDFRGKGLSKWLVQEMMSHPDLQGIRRFVLVTYDAQSLYEQFGFRKVAHPERYMEIIKDKIYE